MESNEAIWYDQFYQEVQKQMGAWYWALMPDLIKELQSQKRNLVELGCGQGHILRYLVLQKFIDEENVFAIDQSKTAVDFVKNLLPKASIKTGDIYRLDYPKNFFDICLLMETIEHLEQPAVALKGIFEMIAPNGILYLSFPNFLHLPWLVVRILAEKLNKPNWIVLQPVDKIHTVFSVIKLVEAAGFEFEKGIGCTYGPPLLDRLETPRISRGLNVLRLWRLSFHPVLKFRRPASSAKSRAAG
jgi:2-polyprenyl-3-methyl-5-hydroxy-6-metoxy-1,4-benzoquinol methylase